MSNVAHIYGHPVSAPSRTIAAYCELSGIQIQYHMVDLAKKEHLTEEYARINPFQTIPSCVYRGYNVWESCSIVPYLADALRVDNQWYPKDPRVRVRINSYLHLHGTGIRDPIAGYTGPKFIYPKFMGAPELSPEAEAPLREKFLEAIDTIKWMISETGFIARTQQATVADVFAYSEVSQSRLLGYNFAQHREVKEWYERIGQYPAVARAHEVLNQMIAKFAA